MYFLNPEPKTNVVLKVYDTYTLLGRIQVKDLKEWNETHDPKLILYKFCENVYREYIPDYKSILENRKNKEREAHLKNRLAKGFKST